ncbi:hypothetical protein QZH41_011166 [Actinostola sp. cb2023]|nr:hypothetical protein QZH41_011166 [Actinostola sp. cb2023]
MCIYKDLMVLENDIAVETQESTRVPCGFLGCDKTYAGKSACWRKHRESCPYNSNTEVNSLTTGKPKQELVEKKEKSENQDFIFNYSCSVLREGLLDWAREDATKENDGDRAVILWKWDFLNFHLNGNIKYRILAFDLVAKVLATLTPRMAASLRYNRCLNINGGLGHNIACDMALEFLNKECKSV